MKRFLFVILFIAVISITAKEIPEPVLTYGKVNIIGNAKAVAPVFDTSRIFISGGTTREVAIGTNFKDWADDTIRVIGIQSGSPRNLYICTDTSTTVFGDNKFRIETPYSFVASSMPNAVAIGQIHIMDLPSIFVGQLYTPYSFFRFQWDATIPGWALKDSFSVGDSINDIAIGLISSNEYPDIFIATSRISPSSQILWLRWNGTMMGYDSLRIYLTGTQRVKGVAVGDVRPDIPGDEVYVVGGTNLWMVYYDGLSASWQSELITSGLSSCTDVAVGDVDPTLPGNEVVICNSSSSYQLSILSYSGGLWSGILWNITGAANATEVAVGDVMLDNPGNEVIVVFASTTVNPRLFWYAPNRTAWAMSLPKNVSSTTDYGIAIGDVNKFRNVNYEYVLSGGNGFYEGEQILVPLNIGTYYYNIDKPISIKNVPQQINMVIFNAGENPATGFTYGYYLKNHPYISNTYIYSGILNPNTYVNVTMDFIPDFDGYDTIFAYVFDPADPIPFNDTTKLHLEVWDDSTVAASGFNSAVFPPINGTTYDGILGSNYKWTRYIISGSYNWLRTTAPTYPSAPVLEGYGVASYPCYNATSGSSARLLTHKFNIGPVARKVILDFYMYHDNGYSGNLDSLYVEYSYDTLTFNTLTGFQRYYGTNGWQKHTVEIGDFSGGTEIYVGFRAVSKFGNNIFIDSVRVFTTTPTAPATDAGIIAVKLPNPPYFVGQSYPVTVTIKNFGLDPLTFCPVYYNWGKNIGTPVGEMWTGYLLANQTADFTFSLQWTPQDPGIDTIWAWTDLPGDMVPANDTSYKEVNVCPEYHIPPYSENFEGDWLNSTKPPFCGWTIIDGGSETPNIVNNNDWHKYLLSATYRNSNVARIYWSPVEWSDDWLISPRFNCSAYGTYTLNYWHYYNDFGTSNLDSGNVMLSTDGGLNWTRIALYQNADDSGYKTIDITPYVNGEPFVKIGFWYVANNEWYWYIDSFSIDFVPDNEPPTITFDQQPQNTYNNGPYPVRAIIRDISKPIYATLYSIVNDELDTIYPNSIIEDTFTFYIDDVSPGTVIEYSLYAEDAAGNGVSTNSYRFFKLAPLGQDTIFATALPDSSVLLEWFNPYEFLAYDDGPYIAGSFGPNYYFATQFTPQYSPVRLIGFASYFYTDAPPITDSLRFIVWDDNNGIPNIEIFDTTIVPLNYPQLTYVDLSEYNIVIPSGDFHIGWQYYNSIYPFSVLDDGSNTTRSKYSDGTDWWPLEYDVCTYAFVEYLPQSKSNTNSVVANLPKGEKRFEFIKIPDIYARNAKRPVFTPKNINHYEVLRRDIMGGPWITIGTPNTNSWIDSPLNLVNHTIYQYAVRTVYTSPDSVSEISPYREMVIDWSPPQYSNLFVDSVQNYLLPSIEIFDFIWYPPEEPLLFDSLFYSINDGPFVGVTHDSMTTSYPYRFYYTIPLQTKVPTNVKFYFTSADKSEWANTGRDPVSGYYETTVGITEIIPDKLFLKISSLVSGRLDIEFGLPKATDVKFSIYNTLGQKITTIDKGKMKAGYYNERIELNIPNGIYFIRLETGEGKIINKLIKVF